MSEQIRLCCAACTCTNSHSALPIGPNGEYITVPEGPNILILSEEETDTPPTE